MLKKMSYPFTCDPPEFSDIRYRKLMDYDHEQSSIEESTNSISYNSQSRIKSTTTFGARKYTSRANNRSPRVCFLKPIPLSDMLKI